VAVEAALANAGAVEAGTRKQHPEAAAAAADRGVHAPLVQRTTLHFEAGRWVRRQLHVGEVADGQGKRNFLQESRTRTVLQVKCLQLGQNQLKLTARKLPI